MRGDRVIVELGLIEKFRKERALSRVQLYKKLSIHFLTGAKMFRGQPISLVTAKKVASALRVPAAEIIARWCGDDHWREGKRRDG